MQHKTKPKALSHTQQALVSSCIYLHNHATPTFSPDPFTFRPERWLDPTTYPDLDRHMVSFSRGSRSCLGMK